ncbi:MAG: aminotransferase class I/II-fold pyridoxal phosphate-dependent enzyme [Bacilli bacterium]|nr:aminotransferase class I/II-fold pyridoxal phosphate-dependent enzyme [Bacilli bacterium]
MLVKSTAIQRLLRENPMLGERRFGLPYVGARLDKEQFNPTVQDIADAIDFYGYEVRDSDIVTKKDIDLGGGNPMKCDPFPLSVKEMINSLEKGDMFKYPYTEGDDTIRKELLEYIEQEGFINTEPYDYEDIDDKGLSIHNITFLPSTSITFNIIINIISKPGDVILIPGPSYGLFTIRAERAGAEVEILPLEKEDDFLVNPEKLAKTIDEINHSLQRVYNRRHGYVPRVVAFLNANPNNPTGKVMGEKETELLTQISQVCLDRGVFVIDDMVYRDVSYDENNIAKPIATIPGMFRNTISLFGLSKSYGMASLRAGFLIADEIIIREVINRIFQEMDSSPDIVGRALVGAFNARPERQNIYNEYFTNLRNTYQFRYNILKAFVEGIDSITDASTKEKVLESITKYTENEKTLKNILKGMPYTKFPKGKKSLEPEAGFFAILDFTEAKGKTFRGNLIRTEKDLVEFFYRTNRLRFLIGQSISWPYTKELIGRVTFAMEEKELINALTLMNDSLQQLVLENSYEIRYNRIEDQEQMAHIKVDSWNETYNGIIDADYLASLDYQIQTDRYIESFDEYKYSVLVAIEKETNKVIGYSCFSTTQNEFVESSDCELVSLYLAPGYTGKGVGKSLFRETVKILKGYNKRNMLVWCIKENKNAIKFYQKLGGIKHTEKFAKIGSRVYPEYGFMFDITKFEK